MKIEVVMPKMGESLQEGTITKWLKNAGDKVERDETILEISTDKVDTEVPAPNSGVLEKIVVAEGETVEVGTLIAVIETEADKASVQESAPAASQEATPAHRQEEPKQEASATATETAVEEEPQAVVSGGETVDLVMPKMGESLQEGTITKWLKNVGDKVERDETVLEISTDKVDTEVPSPVSGVLSQILVQEGETVEVGTAIGIISVGGSVQVAKKAESKPATKQAAQSTPQPSKSETPAPKPTGANGINVPVNGTKDIPTQKDGKFFSPLVRSIAEDNGITLEELLQIKGSGLEGRVNKDDIMNYIKNRSTSQPAQQPAAQPASKPDAQPTAQPTAQSAASKPAAKAPSYPIATDDVEVIPMDRVRQLISEHMVYSKHTSPHVTSVAEVDVTNIVNYREKNKAAFEKREGFKLTYTPFFIQAAIEALKQFPMTNVSVDGKNIIRHKHINMGMATALPDGNLIVPVIKQAEVLNLTGIARAVWDLASRARSKKLNPDDIQGGTFTITNVGTFGTLFGTPIINQPQCGIFGVGAIKKRAVVKEVEGNDLILVRHMMYASITYDHRVIDGQLAGQTLAAFCKALEAMNESNINF